MMLSELIDRLAAPSAWLALLAAKSSLVLLLAACLAPLVRNKSASVRHAYWSVAILIVVSLPLLGACLPGWSVGFFTGLQKAAPRTIVAEDRDRHEKLTTREPESMASGRRSRGAADGESGGIGAPPAMASAGIEVAPDAPSPAAVETNASIRGPDWKLIAGTLIPAAWLVGTFFLLVRLGLGPLLLRRWRTRAQLVQQGRLARLFQHLRHEYGLRRPCELLASPRAALPLTWGVLRPRVLVPNQMEEWPEAQARIALAHELAHVRRGDQTWQLVAEAGVALYWWNPLVWFVRRRLAAECESACDDLVLRTGIAAPDYAEALLTVVQSLSGATPANVPAVAFARSSQVADRIARILNNSQSRGPLCRSTAIALATASLVLSAGLATT